VTLTSLLANHLLTTRCVVELAGIGALSVITPRAEAYRRALRPHFISLPPTAPVRRTTTLVAAEYVRPLQVPGDIALIACLDMSLKAVAGLRPFNTAENKQNIYHISVGYLILCYQILPSKPTSKPTSSTPHHPSHHPSHHPPNRPHPHHPPSGLSQEPTTNHRQHVGLPHLRQHARRRRLAGWKQHQ
jgi:hypothetical protein